MLPYPRPKNPRVLFVVNSLTGGGAERVCLNMANAMAVDYDVDVVVLYGAEDQQSSDSLHIYTLSISREVGKVKKIAQLIAARNRLNEIVRKRERDCQYRLITAHLASAHLVVALSDISNRCLYIHHSLPAAIERLYPPPVIWLMRKLYRMRRNVCVSEGVRKQAIEKFAINPKSVEVIFNCVSLEHIRELASADIDIDRPYILCVGRLVQSKRFDRMIDIFATGGFSSKYDLVFLGDGPLRASLAQVAKGYRVEDHVRFMGYVDNPFAWMHASSAMVMTSDREALPTVLVEGLMAGARIISSDCDFGPREILTGDLARFLVPPDDIAAYIAALDNALAHYPKVEDGYFERFSAEAVIRRYIAYYDDCFDVEVDCGVQ